MKLRHFSFFLLPLFLALPTQAAENEDNSKKQFELPSWLRTASERVELRGYAQAGYNYETTKDATLDNTLKLYRVFLWANIKITDRWSMRFMHDFCGKPHEFFTDFRITKGNELNVRFGQFKHNLSMENPMSPAKVELINVYSQAVTYLAGCGTDPLMGVQYGRDLGLEFFGTLAKGKLLYNAALMNGQGICVTDKNHYKDLILKLDYRPMENLRFVASGQIGKGHAIATSTFCPNISEGENYKRNRATAGFEYKSKPITIRAEYLAGWDKDAESQGAYCTFCVPLCRQIEAIGSIDYFDRNKELDFYQTNYTVGLQYWFAGKCRIQAQYTRCQSHFAVDSNLLQAQMQVGF